MSELRSSSGNTILNSKQCSFCDTEFNLRKRKRKCKHCEQHYCSDCCSLKATYPASFKFTTPQWVCNECMPRIFELRGLSLPIPEEKPAEDPPSPVKKSPLTLRKSKPKIRRNSGLNLDGSFYTTSDADVHTAFKLADPVCRLVFRFSGMYQGGKFDRSTLQKAMKMNKVGRKLPSVGKVERFTFQVSSKVDLSDWDPDKLYVQPPFLPVTQKKRRNRVKSKSKSKSKKSRATRKSTQSEEATEPESVPESNDESIPNESAPDKSEPAPPVEEKESGQWDEISVFVYHPKDAKPDEELPVLIWYHGGGFCIGSIEDLMYETTCRTFCRKIRCIVVSVEYRLAPEFRFPTQIEDAYWALLWVHAKGKELFGADISRIALAGDSAGGSLSAIVSLLSKFRNGPKLVHQALVYPCLANPCNDNFESQVKYKNGPLVSKIFTLIIIIILAGFDYNFFWFIPLVDSFCDGVVYGTVFE
jgi:hypothetical protein